jgi:hypothetical protein
LSEVKAGRQIPAERTSFDNHRGVARFDLDLLSA